MNIQINSEVLLKAIFEKFNANRIEFVWVHSYDNLKEENDVDIVVDEKSFCEINEIFLKICDELSLRVIQLLQHESHAKYFVLVSLDVDCFFVKIDPCTDFMRDGRILLNSKEILKDRIAHEYYYIPRPEIEAIYILLKKILKGKLTDYHKLKLQSLYKNNKIKINSKIIEYIDERFGNILIEAIEKNDWYEVEYNLVAFRKNILKKKFQKSPLSVFKYWFNEVIRIILRILKPTGLVIALIGPDGVGKSTLSTNILPIMQNTFRKTLLQHWRPGLLPKIANIVGTEKYNDASTPHKRQVQNNFISILKFIYYWFDYLLGYFILIYPKKVKSTFILFDRYYYDYYFDPKRFRISLPKQVIKFFINILPKPDLVLILKAEPQEIYKRKKELSLDEIAVQQNTVDSFFSSNYYCRFIDASNDIETMVKQSLKSIFDFLNSRYIDRYIN